MTTRKTTTAKKTTAKKAAASPVQGVVEKLYGEKIIRQFTVDLDDIRVIWESVDELQSSINAVGSLKTAALEIELSGGNAALVELEGDYGSQGIVTLLERE